MDDKPANISIIHISSSAIKKARPLSRIREKYGLALSCSLNFFYK
jgi:hypothetical protein